MHCILVSHSHWDREWHRTFESFRARLVDMVDRVLDLAAADPGFRFLLDGQTVVVEDYLALRPGRRPELDAACAAGRIAVGPWYVQPDMLLPSGEALVRNLLEGRRTATSRVAYCPDSFGHPAQLPQVLAGFGLEPFVYWRGNGDELDGLGATWVWEAPDGSAVVAHHLAEGYFAAAGLAADVEAAARWLAELAQRLARGGEPVLLMNGFDHALPDAHAGAAAAALAKATGWTVERGTLDDFARLLPRDGRRFRGALRGARAANLLAGVWSARTPLKLRNRRCEALLEGWAEPFAALAAAAGARDERPALRAAWRALLQNQAHDSIGGCSQDRVHEQMAARYDTAEELARETAARALERLAGLGTERVAPTGEAFDVAVFNPSPDARTDLVRLRLAPHPWLTLDAGGPRLHPWLLAAGGWTVDGEAARVVADEATDRIRLVPEDPPPTIEFVARDVPAFGWRRFRLAPAPGLPDAVDGGREIACDGIVVRAEDDGTLAVRLGGRELTGLAALEDVGDRGDSYDCDPVATGDPVLPSVECTRRPSVPALTIRRVLSLPSALAPDRGSRTAERVPVVVETDVRLVPGTGRVDLAVRVENTARDHVGSSRVDLQACKLEYSIVSPK